MIEIERVGPITGLGCLEELERRVLLEIAGGMFGDKISDDAELEVNEDIIDQIHYVVVKTKLGERLSFTVSKSALDSLCEKLLEGNST